MIQKTVTAETAIDFFRFRSRCIHITHKCDLGVLQLTSRAHKGQAADIWRVVSSIHPSHGPPWRCLPGGRACSAWGILQTRKGNEKGAWLYNCGQWQWGSRVENFVLPMGTSRKGAIGRRGSESTRLSRWALLYACILSLPHIGYWGSFVSIKSSKIPQIHEPANF